MVISIIEDIESLDDLDELCIEDVFFEIFDVFWVMDYGFEEVCECSFFEEMFNNVGDVEIFGIVFLNFFLDG